MATPPADDSASSSGAATPEQVAQIVNQEFPTYDADTSGDLSETEFATWMTKLRTATDPTVDPQSEQVRSEEHTSELQSLMRISYAVLCLKKKKTSEYMIS